MKVKELMDRLSRYNPEDDIQVKNNHIYVIKQDCVIEISPLTEFVMKVYGYPTSRCDGKRVAMKSDYLRCIIDYRKDFKTVNR